MFCSQCGFRYVDTVKICPRCGVVMPDAVSVAADNNTLLSVMLADGLRAFPQYSMSSPTFRLAVMVLGTYMQVRSVVKRTGSDQPYSILINNVCSECLRRNGERGFTRDQFALYYSDLDTFIQERCSDGMLETLGFLTCNCATGSASVRMLTRAPSRP